MVLCLAFVQMKDSADDLSTKTRNETGVVELRMIVPGNAALLPPFSLLPPALPSIPTVPLIEIAR